MQNPNQGNALKVAQTVGEVSVNGHRIESAFLEFADAHGRNCAVYAERCLLDREHAPALVHCPGGGQTVNRADLVDWANKGFSSVSFDWQIGNFPNHDPEKKSRWPEGVSGQSTFIRKPSEAILPLAIQAAGVCIDWLVDSGRVNPDAIGVTGISWGGYLTWLIAAYEPRVKAAVPVYGCGGHFDPRHPGKIRLSDKMNRYWRENWDPCSIPGRQTKPVCYLSCTNDFFGILPLANGLLDSLTVPHQRGWLPNCNHSIGPGESKLGLAWFRHYLLDGPALPTEPVLNSDYTIAADQAESVQSTEIWWTSELRDGDLGCWIQGKPDRPPAAAYGRVHYKQGYTLSSPLISPAQTEIESTTQARSQSQSPSTFAIGWHWAMGSTQFHTNRVTLEEASGGSVRLTRDPAKTDDAPSFFINNFADPEWNTGKQQAVRIGLRTEPAIDLTEVTVTLVLRGVGGRNEITATLTLNDTTILIDPETFPGFPAVHTWQSVVRMHLQVNSHVIAFIIGPLIKIP